MSERTQAPRSGGRTADQRSRRDADAQRRTAEARAARGERHANETEVGRADTRRSGIGRDGGKSTRGRGGETELPRSRRDEPASVRREPRDTGATGRPRDTDRVRLRPRDTDGLRIKPREKRDTDGVRVRARGTDSPRLKARDTEGVRRVRGHANDTDDSRVADRNGSSLGRGLNGGRLGSPAGRDRKTPARRGRMADALGGRRRAQNVVDAPVDGTAALQVEVNALAEPLKVTDAPKPPKLRVAPPAPIRVPRAPFVATVLGVVVVGVLGILLINTKTNENSFRIADLEKQNTALDNQTQDLDNQLVQASSIGNLDAAARRLGMVKADKLALFRLPDGKVIGVPTPTDGKVAVTAQDPKAIDSGQVADKGAANVLPQSGASTGAQQPATGQTSPAQPTLGAGQTGTGQPTLGEGQTGQGQTGQGQGQTSQGQTGQGATSQNQTVQDQSGQGQTDGTGQ